MGFKWFIIGVAVGMALAGCPILIEWLIDKFRERRYRRVNNE
jgi:hypothetical protein